jgi:hypothetical protein
VVYNDGRRAIIAIEKGTPGDRAFEEAFKKWADTYDSMADRSKGVVHGIIDPPQHSTGSSPPAGGEWVLFPSDDASTVAAAFEHNDGGGLIVMCSTKQKLIAIVHKEPRANWKKGETIDVITRDDDGVGAGGAHALVISPMELIVRNDSTFDLWSMGNAKRFFTVSAGDYARIYPAKNFKRATEPVLQACGDRWQ